MTKIVLTARGAEMLREEVKKLKGVERPRVVQAIAEARAHGDLKENAEYHAAREQQGLMEARIRDIEYKLGEAHIIDVTTVQAHGKVIFGSTVDLMEINDEVEVTYQIVGEDEANIKKGMISFNSPIARALVGKQKGDEVIVNTPGGERCYEIVEVRYV